MSSDKKCPTPRADAIVDAYLEKCDRMFPDGSSAEDIERDLRDPIGRIEIELREAYKAFQAAPSSIEALYTPEQEKAAKYIVEATDQAIGGGDDPVGFLIASHAMLRCELREAERELAERNEQLRQSCDEYRAEHGGCCAASATRPISGISLIKLIRDQRDECADALRALAKVVEDNFPMPAGVHPGSPLDRARKALANVPTYEQRLRNIAEGIGMTYEDLLKAITLNATADDGGA